MTAAGIAANRPDTVRLPAPLADVTRSRNAWIEVDLGALDVNVAALRAACAPGVELIAIVKANAYGHGAAVLGPALASMGVARLGVAWMAEAVALRRAGARGPLIVLGHSFPADAPAAVEHDITLTVHSLELGNALSAAATSAGTTARVHVKVDTGLHRFGLPLDDAVALAEQLRTLPGIDVEGLWTHMANADEADDSFSDQQLDIFAEAVRRLPWIPYRHAANSASILRRPGLHFEGTRAGLAVYGVAPGPHAPASGLRPALQIKARLARVVELQPGDGVSYGLAWKAAAPATVGLVPVGYGDGWHRRLGHGSGDVLVHGVRCPLVGLVMMDHFMVDLTALPGAASEGDEVVLLGTQDAETISADELAERAGTISWDILASLQARLPRLYHRQSLVEAID
ncbi:MAG: alanine racemase [Tepidiformaceae bacterium]